MGITGLLQNLKSVFEKTHLESLKGSKVAIDGYSWLHKGAYFHGKALCEGQFTDAYVKYFMSRIDLLLSYGITPIVVFDGCRLPSKEEEEASRRKSREENLAKARAQVKAGNHKGALEFYNRAVNISASMAKVVIEHLRDVGVDWIVAPYEADAQMAFLALHNYVDIVITEDSDLLAYGCPRVLFKLDKDGWGMLVENRNLNRAKEMPMLGWNAHMFLTMCIMSGCDFLDNIPGLGIKTAAQLVQQFRSFANIILDLKSRKKVIPPNYEIRFQRAIWVFRHQRIWDPVQKVLGHLRPLPPGGLVAADVDVPAVIDLLAAAAARDAAAAAVCETSFGRRPLGFLGPTLDPEIAAGICKGDLDPATKQPFDLYTIFRGWKNVPSYVRMMLAGPPKGLVLMRQPSGREKAVAEEEEIEDEDEDEDSNGLYSSRHS
uniref:Exonuclease 1 n=1 Tax=Polytomella parva TaxID=51329 RepID=A0A7S0US38_9CHLO|mmetsp:Transcript_14681/g.25838  ORF Transcript_14681/g.25838 Transcript_14681/m.25838 type:complete len:432 (+) Transcript_14681:97-1392(+)